MLDQKINPLATPDLSAFGLAGLGEIE